MRVFARVVEAKSFSAAADRLGMSKSLVSRHVSALDRSLSVKLLCRSTRRLNLTEASALFYEHCARIVQEAALAEQRLSQTQAEPAGLVKVTATPAFAVRHVRPALKEFYSKYPKIRVQLSCSNRSLDLGETGFDLGIRISFKPEEHLVARRLAADVSGVARKHHLPGLSAKPHPVVTGTRIDRLSRGALRVSSAVGDGVRDVRPRL
ncbi:MAG: LysR family transcriptional regulator [Gammaproteobacteria bacterium]